jgi:hypothetical protein
MVIQLEMAYPASLPHLPGRKRKTVEQAADTYANDVKPNSDGEYYHHLAIDNAFIAGAYWQNVQLQSTLTQKDHRIAELERERDMHKTIVQSCLSVFEYVLENNDGVGVCLGYQADSIMESMVKKIKALPIPPQH